jgi:hypothetical protein
MLFRDDIRLYVINDSFTHRNHEHSISNDMDTDFVVSAIGLSIAHGRKIIDRACIVVIDTMHALLATSLRL